MALMESRPRAASIMQTPEIVVLHLNREVFERQLGSPMRQFQAWQYNSDPRKLLATKTGGSRLDTKIGGSTSDVQNRRKWIQQRKRVEADQMTKRGGSRSHVKNRWK